MFLLEIVIDNVFPRVTWKMTIKSLWIITLVFGVGNIVILGILGGMYYEFGIKIPLAPPLQCIQL